MEIKVIKLENQGLQNKTQYYLIIKGKNGKEHTMNVGKVTYDIVNDLLLSAETKEGLNQIIDKETKINGGKTQSQK